MLDCMSTAGGSFHPLLAVFLLDKRHSNYEIMVVLAAGENDRNGEYRLPLTTLTQNLNSKA